MPRHDPDPGRKITSDRNAFGSVDAYTTLHKYYREELDTAHIESTATVAQTAYAMAKSGKWPVMTIFWLKTQAGWRETSRMEHAGQPCLS